MSVTDPVFDLLVSLEPWQAALLIALASASLLLVEERRLSVVPLLVQYLLLGPLLGSQIRRPVLLTRVGLGIAVCLILLVTAMHVQRKLGLVAHPPGKGNELQRGSVGPAPRGASHAGMGLAFRLMVMALGGLVAYGMWRAYPLAAVPVEISLAAYWLLSMGLLVALTSVDPLRTGLGILTVINGFEGIYLYLQESLAVIGLLGMVNILLALGIATCSETWLESLEGEAAG